MLTKMLFHEFFDNTVDSECPFFSVVKIGKEGDGQTPFIPNLIKTIITRIIAALIAPCAGLLRLVGVLQLLYSKPATPNHIFSWVRISFEACFEFDPKTAMSK